MIPLDKAKTLSISPWYVIDVRSSCNFPNLSAEELLMAGRSIKCQTQVVYQQLPPPRVWKLPARIYSKGRKAEREGNYVVQRRMLTQGIKYA